MLHFAIKGYELDAGSWLQSSLVFLMGTSGSMNQANKLPLLKNAFKMLLSTLSVDDSLFILVYVGSAGVQLAPTCVKNKAAVFGEFSRLHTSGQTAGGEGIRLAYQLAQENYKPKGVNRAILATGGDFNVGMSDQSSLKSSIERKRNSGVCLSVLGFWNRELQ